jgi:hypothetical protein
MKGKKKLIIPLIILVPLFILFTSYFMFYKTNQKTSGVNSNSSSLTEIEPIYKNLGSLKIMVDPRIELLTAIQLQSGYQVLTQFDFDYKNHMADYFNNYKDHKAVKEFNKLNNVGFNFDAPPAAMLFLTNPPVLEQKLDYSNELIDRAGSKKKLLSFHQSLSDFSIKSKFTDFYKTNIPFYETIVDNVYNDLMDLKLTEALDRYYGMEVNSYNIIIAPMLHNGGYGPSVEADNGLYDIFGIIGPEGTKEDRNEIVPIFSGETISNLVWHEFSHSFVNPTTDKYDDEINKYKKLYTKISSEMSAQAYIDWKSCVNEHIVRAVTTRLTYLNLGQDAGDAALANERSRGFYYIDALCESLKQYENNRDTYPTFESYYPQLIEVFKVLFDQDLPDSFFEPEFVGPINSVMNYTDTMKLIVITPTNEDNVQQEIDLYIELIKSKFWPEAELVDDIDALERDLSNYTIIAYGTMKGNLWLNHYKETFPFEINDDSIRANNDYDGANLTFITALPNPQNYKNPLLIYTAQKSDDIVDINSIFHGATDYIIAKDFEEVYSGFYSKDNEKWTFLE